MGGYVEGIIAILCINLIFAYGVFLTAASGQLNLGGAGFQAIGAYVAGVCSNSILHFSVRGLGLIVRWLILVVGPYYCAEVGTDCAA